MTSEVVTRCPHPHEEDSWCMLCSGRVCEHCSVRLSGGQQLCRECHENLVELNGPMSPSQGNGFAAGTTLLNPEKAPLTFGFCALLIGIYMLTSYPVFTEAANPILDRFALDGPAIAQTGQYERLITGNLLHANLTHLGFNVMSLLIFGSMLEPRIHKGIYALWLILFMAGCDLFSLWLLPNASIGASGIAYGLQFAFLVMAARHTQATQRQGFWRTLLSLRSYLFIILLLFASDWMSDSAINVYGHLGGAVLGILAAGPYPLKHSPSLRYWIWTLCLLIATISTTLTLLL